jgi:site-specific recombinase XerD
MRRIPLNAPALAALKAARHLRSKLVFCHEDGRRLSYVHTLDHLHAVCRKAGLREIGWHTLRHTFASHLVMAGVTLKAVQELMGHATIEMTLRYAHLAPGVTRDAVAALAGAGQQQVNKSTAEQKQQ